MQESQVREHLNKLDIPKSMGNEGLHPRVLRELVNVTARPLSIIFQRSWLVGEVPEDWKEANVSPILKKGKKEDLGSCQPVSSNCLLDTLTKYRLDKRKVRWIEN